MNWHEKSPVAFEALRARLRAKYPTLRAHVENGAVIIQGGYEVVPGDWYGLSITLPGDYPHSLPEVRETAERIPLIQDRHVNPSNATLCLGVPEHLWLTCKGDFSFEHFLEGPIRNFLIGNSLVEEGKSWPFGETSHGGEGILQFYTDLMGITDTTKLTKFLRDLSKGRVPGHSPCPCGSGKIIRSCHAEGWRSLWNVPKTIIAYSALQAATLMNS